jgi:hypothetical protein
MNKETIKELLKVEFELYCYVVDLLAKEYGWSVEYIQDLQVPAIAGLIKAIRKRKDIEDRLMQLNIAKGMSGDISSNYVSKEKRVKEDEERNLRHLARMLGTKVEQKRSD